MSKRKPTTDDQEAGRVLVECTSLPRVTVKCTQSSDKRSLLLSMSARGGEAHVRTLQIMLDQVRVAKTREDRVVFTRPLDELKPGKHRVQFVAHFDSGDMQMWVRNLDYNGEATRDSVANAVNLLRDHAVGTAVPSTPILWKLDESVALPATVLLRCRPQSQLYIQQCVMFGTHAELVRSENGTARLELKDDSRYFSVGDLSFHDGLSFFELSVEAPVSTSGLWVASPRMPAAYAVCVGISKYKYISSLEYCDEDAVSWCDYLSAGGYVIRLFGDGVSSYSPYTPTALATEANVRQYVHSLVDVVRPGDLVMFIDSGHGSGDGKGHSWVCMLDEHGAPDGEFDDTELADDMCKFTQRDARVVCFMDCCLSGGLIDNMEERCGSTGPDAKWFMSTTCSMSGFGFDDSRSQHGAWTSSFLVRGLQMRFKGQNPTLGEAHDYALSIYPYKKDKKNEPMCGGNRSLRIFQ